MPEERVQSHAAVAVALLEDQRVLRETMADMLQSHGFQVLISSSSPEDFLEKIEQHEPAVALVDLRLSGDLDDNRGWEVIRRLRESYPNVRVAVLSATQDAGDIERTQREGVAAFLSKDTLGREELLEALGRVAEGERIFPLSTGLRPASAPSELPRGALSLLTARELQVLRHVAAGHDNLKTAAYLGITERTVRAHVSNLYRKLGPENRAQLALCGLRLGITPASDG